MLNNILVDVNLGPRIPWNVVMGRLYDQNTEKKLFLYIVQDSSIHSDSTFPLSNY